MAQPHHPVSPLCTQLMVMVTKPEQPLTPRAARPSRALGTRGWFLLPFPSCWQDLGEQR